MTVEHATIWAEREFGSAALGDERRNRRAVRMAAQIVRSPGAHLSAVFPTAAEREGAYRFVENDAIDAAALMGSALDATARRCFEEEYVFVPVDGTSLNLPDPEDRRGMGAIGTHGVGAQGLQVMSAIAVDTCGVPIGMCGQRYWPRREAVRRRRDGYDRRSTDQKETRYWLELLQDASEAFQEHAPATRPFFQLDRGGDAWPILAHAVDQKVLLTTRATHNRRLVSGDHLWPTVSRTEPQGCYVLDVPEGPNRRARQAVVHVQHRAVDIDIKDRRSGRHRTLRLWAVRVLELDTAPRGETPIEWMLLTTFPVHSVDDALLVVRGYESRWRIEEFHKTLKSGACRIEDTLLHRREHVERFAVMCSSVAVHIQRLLHFSRTCPDEPATIALTRHEIDATILLREPKGVTVGAMPSISDAVRWIADIGGFMGPAQKTLRAAPQGARSTHRPTRRPGAIVLRRGLERIEPVALVLSTGRVKL